MKTDMTQIIAIYGAVISSILLILRFRDRSDKKRKLLVRIDKFTGLNEDKRNYHNGRMGSQFIRIRITNKSSNPNSIEKVELKSCRKIVGLKYSSQKVELNFDHNFNLPIGIGYSAMETGLIFINMNPYEFHKSWKSNYEILSELKHKNIYVIIEDTQGKKYKSNTLKIDKLLLEFLDKERELTTENYWIEHYDKSL
uniref:hypothetical protein n=1 Tax=Mariniflexile sp. TaxID=1979402 RepID=UPI0040480871